MTKDGAISETLQAMLQQEKAYYTAAPAISISISTTDIINPMVTSLENIRHLLRVSTDTLMLAASYLQRYLQATTNSNSTPPLNSGRVALVCFYMACKINEPAALPISTLSDLLSRFLPLNDDHDSITVSWEELELDVCSALRWRLNPPLSMAFIDQFLSQVSEGTRRLRKRSQACLEAAFRANPSTFVSHPASALAMAALLLAEREPSQFDAFVVGASEVGRALAFLRSAQSSSNTNSCCPSSPPLKKNRKRCVTPTLPPDEQQRFRKRHKTQQLSPCLISRSALLVSTPPPPRCLQSRSPRSAFSMAE